MSQETELKKLILDHFKDTNNSQNVTAAQTEAITREEFLQREKTLQKEINKLKKKINKLKNRINNKE